MELSLVPRFLLPVNVDSSFMKQFVERGFELNTMGTELRKPRGPILIDARTRDIVQDVYIRRVVHKNGELYNMQFDGLKPVHDPGR